MARDPAQERRSIAGTAARRCACWFGLGVARLLLAGVGTWICLGGASVHAGPPGGLMSAVVEGETKSGLALVWQSPDALVLQPDGRLSTFPIQAAKKVQWQKGEFKPLNAADMIGALRREFSDSLEITTTANYIVAHPRGLQWWAHSFERTYREFEVYFSTRGFKIRTGRFPLVAIVFPDQSEFLQYMQRDRGDQSRELLGYYSVASNRIALFNSKDGQLEATIRHEAAHQVAYNVGLHSRVNHSPRWVIEGLGVLMEVDGGGELRHPSMESYLRTQVPEADKLAQAIADLVSDDRLFDQDPHFAYAVSWAMTHYLAQRRSSHYVRYLERLVRYPALTPYRRDHRERDFAVEFSIDPQQLARFILDNELAR
jgi:hypothetical protein